MADKGKVTVEVGDKKYTYEGRVRVKGKTDEEISNVVKAKLPKISDDEITAIVAALKAKPTAGKGTGKGRKSKQTPTQQAAKLLKDEEQRNAVVDLLDDDTLKALATAATGKAKREADKAKAAATAAIEEAVKAAKSAGLKRDEIAALVK